MTRLRGIGATLVAVSVMSGCAWVGRVGVSTTGAQPTAGTTTGTDVSTTGRYVVFTSDADNLVAGDTNNVSDVFWRDNQTGTTERVSVGAAATQANGASYGGHVSTDGRYVAFTSLATNLVIGDTNAAWDVFLRDRLLGTTTRVSVGTSGGQSDGGSWLDAMTPDAKVIVFSTVATNLVATVDTNNSQDVYVRDLNVGQTQRISQASDGTAGDFDSSGGSISDDGRFVAFVTDATTFDPTDSGLATDAYLRDRVAKTTTRITAFADGTEANANTTAVKISGNGKVVTFDTDASNLLLTGNTDDGLNTDVYAKVIGTDAFERISIAADGTDPDSASSVAGISSDGRYVVFESGAKNLIGTDLVADSNAFIRDRTAQSTVLAGTTQSMAEPIAVTPTGPDALSSGSTPNAMSADGRYILFTTNAPDVLASGDTNGSGADVYLRSNPVPLILFASPSTIPRGTTGTIALHGSSLNGAGALTLMGDGITVNSVTPKNDTEVDVSITVAPGAAIGPRTPFLVQAGYGAGPFTGGLVFLPSAFSVV